MPLEFQSLYFQFSKVSPTGVQRSKYFYACYFFSIPMNRAPINGEKKKIKNYMYLERNSIDQRKESCTKTVPTSGCSFEWEKSQ
jgi:hypothetical protein